MLHQSPGKQIPATTRIFRGTIRILLSDLLAIPCGLLTLIVLTRSLGPARFGLYALATSLIGWVEWSWNALISRASIKLVGGSSDWKSVAGAVLRLYMTGAVVLSGALLLLCSTIAEKWNEPALSVYLRWLILDILIFSATQAASSILVGREEFVKRSWLSLARWLGKAVFIVGFVVLIPSVFAAILGWILGSLLELVVAARCVGSFQWRTHVSKKMFLEFFEYAAPLSIFGLILLLYSKLDLFILKLLGASSAIAGIYGAAQNVAVGVGYITAAFSPALLATLTRLIARGEEREASSLVRSTYLIITVCLPLIVFGSAIAPELVQIAFGPRYEAATFPLRFLIGSAFCILIIYVNASIFTALGRPSLAMFFSFPMIACAFAGYLLLIPDFGVSAAALINFAVAAAIALSSAIAVFRIRPFELPAITILRSILISLFVWWMCTTWKVEGILLPVKWLAALTAVPVLFYLTGEWKHTLLGLWSVLLTKVNSEKEPL